MEKLSNLQSRVFGSPVEAQMRMLGRSLRQTQALRFLDGRPQRVASNIAGRERVGVARRVVVTVIEAGKGALDIVDSGFGTEIVGVVGVVGAFEVVIGRAGWRGLKRARWFGGGRKMKVVVGRAGRVESFWGQHEMRCQALFQGLDLVDPRRGSRKNRIGPSSTAVGLGY